MDKYLSYFMTGLSYDELPLFCIPLEGGTDI